jgi:hypothetical protein
MRRFPNLFRKILARLEPRRAHKESGNHTNYREAQIARQRSHSAQSTRFR